MTHLPEIGAKNRYRFLTRLTCNLVPNFSGISKVTNRTCSAFVPVYGTSFLVHGFSAPISGKYVMGIFLTVVGRKVLSHFSFVVTPCHYLINCMKDSCCFIVTPCHYLINCIKDSCCFIVTPCHYLINCMKDSCCFIVTPCRYLINCMKDSCCFIDDYCSVIILSCTL